MNESSIYDRSSISSALDTAVDEVSAYVSTLDKQSFEFAPEGKWNAGQQLDHLVRSIKPLNLAYAMPGFLLRIMFGKADRDSKSYNGLVEKYETRLAAGGARASGRFVPVQIPYERRSSLLASYKIEKEKLIRKIERINESRLDKCILPHPLLGKLTMREMLFFTIHHNYHHLKVIQKYLQEL